MLDYGPGPAPAPPASESTEPSLPAPTADALPSLPTDSDSEVPALGPATDTEAAADDAPPPTSQIISISTDVLDIEIDTLGGRLQKAVLKNYPIAKDQPDTMVQLLSLEGHRFATLQSGLIAEGNGDEAYFNAKLRSAESRYELNGADELVVPLLWDNGEGIRIEKRLRFTPGSYRIDVEHRVSNDSESDWRAAQYTVLHRKGGEHERSMFDVDSYSFDGPIIYDGDKSEKLEFDDLQKGPYSIVASDGWIGGIEHHFVRAIVPPADTEYRYDVSGKAQRTTASVFGPAISVAAGESLVLETTLFVGPKLQDQLEEIRPSLKLTVDYGFLTLLSNPLFWLLSHVYSVVGNWGLAIILVTVLIKLAFYKLTEKSGRSMAKMREIQPRMKAIQERYKDDRQAQSQAMMDLYKREKVNPAAGCLPILIQMPFFLAFYWVLLESVEMRQAPFALWITDLSSRDPYFILPLIMGVAMLMQQKLNPAPADPVQAKVMQIMPIVFTGFFAFFPSGLVLYWVTNTVLSIAQQWYVNKVVEEESRSRKAGKSRKKGNKGEQND
jgi:YidC/Oxa1 family membrane protein insertase